MVGGMEQRVSRGDPSPSHCPAVGLCATHIVGVIILVVGQLHHPIGALQRGTAMGHQLGTIQKTHIIKPGSGLPRKPTPQGSHSWWAMLGQARGCTV